MIYPGNVDYFDFSSVKLTAVDIPLHNNPRPNPIKLDVFRCLSNDQDYLLRMIAGRFSK